MCIVQFKILIFIFTIVESFEPLQKHSVFIRFGSSFFDGTMWALLFAVIMFVQFDIDLVIVRKVVFFPRHYVAMHMLAIEIIQSD